LVKKNVKMSTVLTVYVLERGLSTGNFESWMKGTVGMERFCLKRLSAGSLWGGLWKMC